jgi:hypothetical protein
MKKILSNAEKQLKNSFESSPEVCDPQTNATITDYYQFKLNGNQAVLRKMGSAKQVVGAGRNYIKTTDENFVDVTALVECIKDLTLSEVAQVLRENKIENFEELLSKIVGRIND